jgi:hypothetical protein
MGYLDGAFTPLYVRVAVDLTGPYARGNEREFARKISELAAAVQGGQQERE